MQYTSLVCFYVLYRWLCLGQYVVFKEMQVHNLPTNNAKSCKKLNSYEGFLRANQDRAKKVLSDGLNWMCYLAGNLKSHCGILIYCTYRRVASSRPVYYSILNSLGQRSQYIGICNLLIKETWKRFTNAQCVKSYNIRRSDNF